MASKFSITAELNLQTKNLNQVVGDLRKQFQGIDLNIKVKDLDKAGSSIRSVAKSSRDASAAVSGLGADLATAAKKFSAVTLATGTLIGFTRAVKNAVSDAIEFEREVVKIAQASGQTVQQLTGLKREITSVSTNFGVSSKELTLAARTLTQAGFAADKAAGALKVLAQTELAATFDSIQDTTEGAIAVLNQFGKEAQRTGSEVQFLENAFSAINQVSKKFAVESADLITAIRTTGSAFESAGGSLNELIGLFTSVRATTRESAESIATGFRTIFTRTQRLDTINNLRQLGIELQDAEGKFVGPIEAVKRLSAALNTLDPKDFRFNLVVEELGGFRQVSKVIPLIQQFSTAQKALNVAQNASGSLAKDATTAQESLAVQISKTREKFSAFIRDLTESNTFKSTVKVLLSLAEAFLRVAETIKPLIPLIAGFAAFKIGSSITESFLQFSDVKKQKRNLGGKIHHFASGGFVPGSGNGDTVPAMLEPGEFVIRKSSVKKLGAGNLARVNKYAQGGVAEIDATKPYIYESKITQEKPKGAGLSESIKQGVVENKKGKKLKSRFGPNDEIKAEIDRKQIDTDKLMNDVKQPSPEQAEAFNHYREMRQTKRYQERGLAFEKVLQLVTINSKNFIKDSNANARIDGMLGDDLAEIKSVKNPTNDTNLLDDMIGGAIKGAKKGNTEKILAGRARSEGLTNQPDVMDLGTLIVLEDDATKFALGGPAEKFKSARAITIPRPETYTYDKPVGADVDQKSTDGKMYKVNALDRLDYNRVNHLVDIDKEKVPADLKELYNKAKPDDRGGIFEKILLSLGKVQSLSSMQNARLDAISHAGNPSEVKSRIQQMNNKEFEEKLWGAIVSNADGSLAEMAMRERMNSNRWTQGDDVFNVGTVEVFEDVTRGLGREINAQEIKTDLEIQQARQQKELSKAATANARAKLQAAAEVVIGDNNDNYLIKGEATKPLSRKNEIYANTIAAIRRTLNIEDMADFWPSIAQMSEQELQQAVKDSIQRRASGGFIEKFANGGFSSGTDTVPAMLTPGEFVINKKSAQKIGYSKLNRMNKVGKYATGGVVQGFNIGGGVSKEKLSSMTPEELKSIGYLNDPNITKFLSPSSHSLINILANSSSAIPNLGALIKANKVNFNDIKNDLSQLAGLTSFSNITPPEELYSNVYGPAFSALISELGFDSSELKANNWTGSVFSGADNSKLIKILRSKIGKQFSYGATGIPATNSFSPIPNYQPDAIDSVSFQITPSLNQFGKMKGIGAFDKANGASLMLPMSNFLLDDVTKIKDSVVLHLTQKGTEISKTADTLTSQYGPKHENAANAHQLLFMMQGKNALKNYSQIAAELMNEYGKKVKQDYDNFLNPPQKPDPSAVPSIDISSVYAIPKNKKELIAKYAKGIQLGTSQELQDFGAVPISFGSDVNLSNKNLTRYTEEEIKAIAAYVSGPNATVGGKPVNSPFGSGGINSTLEYIAKGQSDKIPFDDAKKQKAAELAKLLDSAANKKSYIPEKIYSGIHQMRLDDVLNQLFSGDILKQAEWTSKKFKDSRKAFKALSSASPIGKTFSISSFLSTSRDDKVAKAFSSDFNNSALLEIATKRSKLNRNRNIFLDSVEREHILPRNSQFKVNGMREHNGRIIFDVQQLAKGGSVFQAKGTDTVPAMLTPGEFVINKKSAEKIGYSNLNRMNKVGKYADGGVVRYYANGDKVEGLNLSSKNYQFKTSSAYRFDAQIGNKIAKAEEETAEAIKKGNHQLAKELKQYITSLKAVRKGVRALDFSGVSNAEIEKEAKNFLARIHNAGIGFGLVDVEIKGLAQALKNANKKYKNIQQLEGAKLELGLKLNESSKKLSKPKTEMVDEYESKLNNAADAAEFLSTRFVTLAGGITSVVAQMSSLDDATKNTITAFSATLIAVYNTGKGMTDVVQGLIAYKKANVLTSLAIKNQQKSHDQLKKSFDLLTYEIIKQKNTLKKSDLIKGKGKGKGSIETEEKPLEDTMSVKAFGKAMSIVNGGLVGFSTALAIGAAASTHFSEQAKKFSNQLDKSIEQLKNNSVITESQITDLAQKSFVNEARADGISKGFGDPTNIMKIIGKSLLGAAGGALGGGPLAMFGGMLGGIRAAGDIIEEKRIEFADQVDAINKVAEDFGKGLTGTARTIKKINDFMSKIESKNREEVVNAGKQFAEDYSKSADSLISAQIRVIKTFGEFAKAPEMLKQRLESLRITIDDLKKSVESLIGNLLQRSARELQNASDTGANTSNIVNTAIEDFRKINTPISSKALDIDFLPKIEQELRNRSEKILSAQNKPITKENVAATEKKLRENLKIEGKSIEQFYNEDIKNLTIEIETMSFEKQMKELELQAKKNTKTALIERMAREKVVGSLREELAQRVVMENLNLSLEKLDQKTSQLDGAFSGTVTALKSSIPNLKVFDLLKPTGNNLDDFNKGLDILRDKGLGPLAENMKAATGTIPKLELALKNAANIGDEIDIDNILKDVFGDGNKSPVRDALKDMMMKMFKPEEGDVNAGRGLNSQQGRERLLQQFSEWVKNLNERGKQILQTLAEYEQQQRVLYQKINESREKQLQLQLDDVDSFERYSSAVARARGRELSLSEKNAFRFEKQSRMVGNMAGNIDAIGQTMLDARNQMQSTSDPQTQARFAETANRTEKALKELANQSERTADTLQEIEKIKAQRENVRDLAKEFAIGGSEQRQEIQKNIANALSVSQTGSFDTLKEEDRSGASAILERFKDLPVFNGQTGKQVENKAIANAVRAAGGNEEIAQMIESDTSTPEEKLIQELRNIYEEESRARQYLSEQENIYQQGLINMLAENAAATRDLAKQLQEEGKELAGGKEEDPNLKNRVDQLDKEINNLAIDILNLDAMIAAWTDVLSENIRKFNAFANTDPMTPLQKALKYLGLETDDLILAFKMLNLTLALAAYTLKDMANFTPGASKDEMKVITDDIKQFAKERIERKKKAKEEADALEREAGVLGASQGGLIYRQSGGATFDSSHPIFKPKGTDTIPAMLSQGEFVIKRSSVNKIGLDTLEAINNGQYAANGGLIYRAIGGIGASAPGGPGYFNINDKNLTGFGGMNKFNSSFAMNPADMARMGAFGGGMMAPLFNLSNYVDPMSFIGDYYKNTRNNLASGAAMANQAAYSRLNKMYNNAAYKSQFLRNRRTARANARAPRFNSGGPVYYANGSVGGLDAVNSNIKETINPQADFSSFLQNKFNYGMMGRPLVSFASNYVDPMSYMGNYFENTRNNLAMGAGMANQNAYNYLNKMYSNAANKSQFLRNRRTARSYNRSSGGPIYRMFGGNAQAMLNPFAAAAFNQSIGFAKNAYNENHANTYRNLQMGAANATQQAYSLLNNMYSNAANKSQFLRNRRTARVPRLAEYTRTRDNLGEIANQRTRRGLNDVFYGLYSAKKSHERLKVMTQYEDELVDLPNAHGFDFPDGTYGHTIASQPLFMGRWSMMPPQYSTSSPLALELMKEEVRRRKSEGIWKGWDSFGGRKKENAWNGWGALSESGWNGWGSDGYATGGFVGAQPFQSGGSLDDDVPAMLTRGEFVMNKNAVQKHGVGFMRQLNNGNVAGYASGGMVGGEPIYRAGGGGVSGSSVDYNAIGSLIGSSVQRSLGSIGKIVNFDALNNLASTFSNLVNRLGGVANAMNGMNMTHSVRIDGQVNVGGFNSQYIAEAIKNEVTNMVITQVKQIMSQAMNMARNINPMG